jgi:hypothetical protein
MKTEDPLLALEIALPAHGSRSLARTLNGQLKSAIRSGRFAPWRSTWASRATASSRPTTC